MEEQKNFKLDFIGIGAEKCGTTWVAEMLNQHPEICLSEPKEIHYFNKRSSYIHNYKNPNYHKSFSWYKKHFIHCKENKIKGEFSTFYIYDDTAPRLIKNHFPNVKLILCLRNPMARAYSQYNMYKYYFKKEIRTFEEVIKKESEYIEKGLYYKQISKYFNYFQRSQILIVFLEDIKKNPISELKKIYDFLRVKNKKFIPDDIYRRSNKAMKIRFKLMNKIMGIFSNTLIKLGLVKLLYLLKKLNVKKFIQKLNTKKYNYNPLSNKTKKEIKKYFINDINKLEKLLNRNLSEWISNHDSEDVKEISD